MESAGGLDIFGQERGGGGVGGEGRQVKRYLLTLKYQVTKTLAEKVMKSVPCYHTKKERITDISNPCLLIYIYRLYCRLENLVARKFTLLDDTRKRKRLSSVYCPERAEKYKTYKLSSNAGLKSQIKIQLSKLPSLRL